MKSIRDRALLVVALAGVPFASSASNNNNASDAGTSPWPIIGDPGGSVFSNPAPDELRVLTADAVAVANSIIPLSIPNDRSRTGAAQQFAPRALDVQVNLLKGAANRLLAQLQSPQAPGYFRGYIKPVLVLEDTLATYRPRMTLTERVAFARRLKAAADDLAQSDLSTSRRVLASKAAFSFLQVGAFIPAGSAQGFGTLLLSPGESLVASESNLRIAAYADGTYIGRLSGSSASTERAGGGVLLGNPDQLVVSLGLSSYFSPTATDADVTLNWCAVSGEETRATTQDLETPDGDRATWILNRERHLLDRIRSGDVWLTGSFRSLSSTDSAWNGTCVEGVFTYALSEPGYGPDDQRNPKAAATISLSGTYSAQHAPGWDEYAAELRLPISGKKRGQRPIYFSARYGTRDDVTLALDFRF